MLRPPGLARSAGAQRSAVAEEVSAFEIWYRSEHARLAVSLVAISGDVDAAASAVDEALVRAYERWPRVGAMKNPRAWVLKVALNELRRQKRKEARERDLVAQMQVQTVPGPAGEIWHVVAQLPERQRLAVVLRYVADLRDREIAAVMGIRKGTVPSTLRDATRGLRRLMDEELTEGEEA